MENEKKQVKRVVKANVNNSFSHTMKKLVSDTIEDRTNSLKEYLMPAITDAIVGVITGTIDVICHGRVRKRTSGNTTRISYKDYYDDRNGMRSMNGVRSRITYDDLTFRTKYDADEALNRMDEILEQFGVVTVADLFDIAGVSGNGYTDNNYGWTSLSSANVIAIGRGMYAIKLPRPKNVNRR